MLLKPLLVTCFLFLYFASAGPPGKRGPKKTKGSKNPKILKQQRGEILDSTKVHAWEKGYYFEGDIIKNTISGRHVVQDVALIWPDAIVPYVISAYFTSEQRTKIKAAMTHISQGSCIQFVPRTEEHHNFVYFIGYPGGGCGTQVGFQKQNWKCYVHFVHLEPAKGCLEHGVILHQLLHVLGFFHQQNAPNRDHYIHVYWGNIMRSKTEFFRKRTDSVTFDLMYDYNSIMHSSWYAYSKDGTSITMVPKTNGVVIGQRDRLSRIDWQKLKRRYKC